LEQLDLIFELGADIPSYIPCISIFNAVIREEQSNSMANLSGMPTAILALLLLTLTGKHSSSRYSMAIVCSYTAITTPWTLARVCVSKKFNMFCQSNVAGTFSQTPDLQTKVLNLQGGTNSLVKDPSGLLLPPNEEAARWLYNYYQTGNRRNPVKVARSAPPPLPYPTPEHGEALEVEAKLDKDQATQILAKTSGYLLESEKELIKKMKIFEDSLATPSSSFTFGGTSWWQKLIYKTSTIGVNIENADAESLSHDIIPELVLQKLKLEADHEAAVAASSAPATDNSDIKNDNSSPKSAFCGGEEYLDYEDEEDGKDTSEQQTLEDQDEYQSIEKGRNKSRKNKIKRRNLLVAPVGDDWSASVWMDRPEAATFDIIALYFGDNATYSCPLCKDVVHAKGPKWRLFLDFSNSENWSTLSSKYDYIMLPDDDLHMNTCAINKVFSTMKTYDLLMAQPSVCHARGSATWRPELHQNPSYLLRYTTFVEVMAPTYRMDFYHSVIRATFSKYWTYVGWGLDSIWPALLHYPEDRIAVIDAVCMRHVPTQGGMGTAGKKSSVYAPGLSPYTAKQEELIVFSAFNYSSTTTWALGENFMSFRVLGSVPNFYVLEAMAKTAGQKWPSVEFAGEYGVSLEAIEPLVVRDKEARKAIAEIEKIIMRNGEKHEFASGGGGEKVTKGLGNLKSRSSIRKIYIDSGDDTGGLEVARARAWVWVVPIVVLAMATIRIMMVSGSSGGVWGYNSGIFGPAGRGWRRIRSYDTSLKR
jgi:hypothetical protein